MPNELNFDDLLSSNGESAVDPQTMGTADNLNANLDTQNESPMEEESYIGEVKDYEYSVNNNGGQNTQDDNDLISNFLYEYGIDDPTKMKFSNENGEIEEIDFHSLSHEEQLEILRNLTDSGLSDREIDELNWLRQNGLTLKDYGSAVSRQSIQDYRANNQTPTPQRVYTVDDYSDDELYIADLKTKYPDFTDQELLSKLEVAKEDEVLYDKEVAALRKSYQDDEDALAQQEVEREKAQYAALQQNLIQAATDFTEVLFDPDNPNSDSLVIEDQDRRQIMSYLLDQDSQGKSQLIRDLENPKTLVQLAWLRLQGQDAISDTSRYWKDTLKETRKENARLQKEIERLKGNKGNSTVVVPVNKNDKKYMSQVWNKLI